MSKVAEKYGVTGCLQPIKLFQSRCRATAQMRVATSAKHGFRLAGNALVWRAHRPPIPFVKPNAHHMLHAVSSPVLSAVALHSACARRARPRPSADRGARLGAAARFSDAMNPAGDDARCWSTDGNAGDAGRVDHQRISRRNPMALQMDEDRLMGHDAMNDRVEVRRLMSWFNDKFFEEVSGPLVTGANLQALHEGRGRAAAHRRPR
jgi:hypothetical protein